MNVFQIGAWIELNVPRDKLLTEVQREVIKSALMRDDTEKAKQMLIDWKVRKP